MVHASSPLAAAVVLDDCWNRIGIQGDQSCPRLREYVHCRNCEVYGRGAATLLDRIEVTAAAEHEYDGAAAASVAPPLEETPRHGGVPTSANVDRQLEPHLLFRVAGEWFALPARSVSQVVPVGPIHSIPRVRGKAVSGVANVRGQLTVCVSLSRLFDLDAGAAQSPDRASPEAPTGMSAARSVQLVQPRFLVVREPGAGKERRNEETVFPVDQVHGVERFARSAHRSVPATLAVAHASHTRAIVDWQGQAVGVLDSHALFDTLRRSLG